VADMRKLLLVVAVALCSAACTTTVAGTPKAASTSTTSGPSGQISQYFGDLNVAGSKGPGPQREFLRETQHPDFTSDICDLGDLTLREEPAMSTLRRDAKWRPQGGSKPRGDVYVVAVSVSVLRNGAALGEQIGLERLVLLDGKVYGFAPCPTG
jgi:hypothetical protein